MKKTLTYGLIIGLQFSLACGFMIVDKKMSPNKTIVSYNDNLTQFLLLQQFYYC